VRRADRDRHPTNPDRKRIAEQEPTPMERLYLHTLIKAQTAQSMPLGFPEQRPVNLRDPRNLVQRQSVEMHVVSNIG